MTLLKKRADTATTPIATEAALASDNGIAGSGTGFVSGVKRYSRRTSIIVSAVLFVLAIGLALATLFSTGHVDRTVIGGLGVGLFAALMILGVPIGAAMSIAGVVGLIGITGVTGGWGAMRRTLIEIPYQNAASWSLAVIPLFIFMGLLLWESGATRRVFEATRAWLNWLPGSQAMAVNLAGGALSAASGSTLGIAYALGRIGIPEMLRMGYHKTLALGAVVMAGLPGQLIPPSLLLVVYAGLANLPVGPQLLAGVVPGLLLIATVSVVIIIVATLFPRAAPREKGRIPWSQRGRTLARVWPVPVLVLVILVGIYTGTFTATESAAAGVAIAIAITFGFCRPKDAFRAIWRSLRVTVTSVGSLFFLIMASAFIARFIALSGIPQAFTDAVQAAGFGPVQFVLAAIVIMFLLGVFLESMSVMLITIPFLLPGLMAYDIDLMWFGVITVLVAETAVMSPPVGTLVYVIYNIARHREVSLGQRITMNDVFVAASAGIPIVFAVILLISIWPELVTWLPSISASK